MRQINSSSPVLFDCTITSIWVLPYYSTDSLWVNFGPMTHFSVIGCTRHESQLSSLTELSLEFWCHLFGPFLSNKSSNQSKDKIHCEVLYIIRFQRIEYLPQSTTSMFRTHMHSSYPKQASSRTRYVTSVSNFAQHWTWTFWCASITMLQVWCSGTPYEVSTHLTLPPFVGIILLNTLPRLDMSMALKQKRRFIARYLSTRSSFSWSAP